MRRIHSWGSGSSAARMSVAKKTGSITSEPSTLAHDRCLGLLHRQLEFRMSWGVTLRGSGPASTLFLFGTRSRNALYFTWWVLLLVGR